jgi:DNA adenine methylase
LVAPKEERLVPLLKYPGGKEQELSYILPNLPVECGNYYEPFVGGGSVYLSVDSEKFFINDKSTELIQLYQMIGQQNRNFLDRITQIDDSWAAISLVVERHQDNLLHIYMEYTGTPADKKGLQEQISQFLTEYAQEWKDVLHPGFPMQPDYFVRELQKSLENKIIRMKKLEKEKQELNRQDRIANLEGACKSAFYTYLRMLYNHPELYRDDALATAVYFFMREFCYSSMFRYNQKGEFNVPYGGISYNRKTLAKKAEYFQNPSLIKQLAGTVISNLDFEAFLSQYPPRAGDFIFLDPPYDTEFSSYAGNEFAQNDQVRLADYLIHHCQAYFMLIIKNTDFILSLYPDGQQAANGDRLYVNRFDKQYMVSFRERNNKNAEHLLITNYPIASDK